MRFLRIVTMSACVDDAAAQEADSLKLSAEARRVLCRLMQKLKATAPALYVLRPDSAWVSADELNLLTAIRNITRGKSSSAQAQSAASRPAAAPRIAQEPVELPDLLAQAGRLTGESDVIIASRPLIQTAMDIHALVSAPPAERQAGDSHAMDVAAE